MKTQKTPAPRRAGTAAKEARALWHARRAIDALKDDPDVLRLFVGMVPLLAVRELQNF